MMRTYKSALFLQIAAAASVFGAVCIAAAPAVRAERGAAQTPADPADARIWIGRASEIEEYLRTVTMVKVADLSVGVTHPRKATLPPGGPVPYLVWKAITPGRYDGYWESYRSEIAAYEFDKLLGLNMVPPTVEKTYRGEPGAAIMWASPTKSFKDLGGVPTPPAVNAAMWARQIVKAKMFDNLIENVDPNLGNWLADPAWNLILIDHSRCFTSTENFTHTMTRVDPDLWARILALTEGSLKPAIGKWVDNTQLKAVIRRRDKMRKIVDQLVKDKGEAYVFMREGGY